MSSPPGAAPSFPPFVASGQHTARGCFTLSPTHGPLSVSGDASCLPATCCLFTPSGKRYGVSSLSLAVPRHSFLPFTVPAHACVPRQYGFNMFFCFEPICMLSAHHCTPGCRSNTCAAHTICSGQVGAAPNSTCFGRLLRFWTCHRKPHACLAKRGGYLELDFWPHPSKLLDWQGAFAVIPFVNKFVRIGEAVNPGPPASGELYISTSNPSGLRGKEMHVADWPPGIATFAETQLSAQTFPAARRALQLLARQQHRSLRVHTGAHAPLRPGSAWAGSWVGVMQASDYPSRLLRLPWTPGLHETGRLMAAQHFLGSQVVSIATLYGYAQGPTWPDSLARTNHMLAAVTQEFILGCRGIRVVTGDLNHCLDNLEETAVWRSLGWVEAQELAYQRWAQPIHATCKGSTLRDFVWLSPEAAALVKAVRVLDVFQEHSTVQVTLAMGDVDASALEWPLPAAILWQDVDCQSWRTSATLTPQPAACPTTCMRQIAATFERSLNGHVQGVPGKQLPTMCYGRSKRLAPQPLASPVTAPRPSRQGEDVLRCDLLGAQIKRWFAQLRRIQSLANSVRAGSHTPPAVEHRVQLWRAIVSAKGFKGGFVDWWRQRPIQFLDSPTCINAGVPAAPAVAAILHDFRCNFRKLEAWHIAQRAKILRSKHEASRAALFRELREPAPEQVDVLVIQHEHSVLAVDPATRAAHLDAAPDTRGCSLWTVNDQAFEPCSVVGDICAPPQGVNLREDDDICQVQTLADVNSIHSEFVSFWSRSWQKHADTAPEHWQRFLSFATAFLPAGQLSLEPITEQQWQRVMRRFKPTAARGPDGWAIADLLHMPRCQLQALLGLLHAVESGEQPWPAQLLVGFVCLLSKRNGQTGVKGYRPIVLYSVIYRAWASLRARQVLRFLGELIDHEAYGFLPRRECMQLWFSVQVQLELSFLGQYEVTGMSTDLIRAFNQLPRHPLLQLARHVGLPSCAVDPWQSFLGSMTRRFLIRGQVSPGVGSTNGFPEGCPLSPIAMALAVWGWHAYLHVFAPRIRSMSYVDNLACVAESVGGVAQSLNLTRCFCDMLDLSLDPAKTFVWSSQPPGRKALASMDLRVCSHARELGGYLSFQRTTHNAELVARCEGLAPIWSRLRRSVAPLSYKLAILPGKCWAHALHGCPGCPLAELPLQRLRTSATKALRIRPAGASSLLRLSVAPSRLADPGFFQLWTCVRDFRRMAQKLPMFLLQWQLFMQHFQGDLFQGPCSKLLAVLSQVHWSVTEPPWVCDHEGLRHHLLRCPEALLYRRLEDAWLWHVSTQMRHRTSMADLLGVDITLLDLDSSRLGPLNAARLGSVRAGAFLFGAAHAKYDNRQSGLNLTCSTPDTVEHRVRHCPRFAHLRANATGLFACWDDLPRCLTHHLLPPANPHTPALRALLHSQPDLSLHFLSEPTSADWQHVFTDGSCLFNDTPDMALAAWASVNASSGQIVACGPLPGLLQTTPRAELFGVISALRWALLFRVCLVLWVDALWVVQGLQQLVRGHDWFPDENTDLWSLVVSLLAQFEDGCLRVMHVPSHLDQTLTASPLEDWLARWNGMADVLAGLVNRNRSVQLANTHCAAFRWHIKFQDALRALRDIFFGIADMAPTQVAPDDEDPEDIDLPRLGSLERTRDLQDEAPLNWRQLLLEGTWTYPARFGFAVMSFLFSQDRANTTVFQVSWLELVFVLLEGGDFSFPVASHDGHWRMPAELPFAPQQPTVAVRVRLLRDVVRCSCKALSIEPPFAHGINLLSLGVGFPCSGICFGLDTELLGRARNLLRLFTANRAVTCTAALARLP